MEQPQKRFPARKFRIKEIQTGSYIRKDNELSYLEINGNPVYRVNIIGTVVIPASHETQTGNMVIDDGSEKIVLRSFDNPAMLENFPVGDLVLVIGKPREFNSEKYIIPEIIKKLEDTRWLKVREIELKDSEKNQVKKIPDEKIPETEEIQNANNPKDRIFNLIQKLDSGDGAEIESVISKTNISNAEIIITELIKEGSVYEVKAGRVKVL